MRSIILTLFLTLTISIFAQELNCKVTVVSSQVSGSNKQVFETLEKTINEYVNNTTWTNKQFKAQEKIQCVLTLNITEQTSSNQFKGNLQIQAVRPVFNSTYKTPVFNYSDDDVSFIYDEYQPLIYSESSFQSNLTSILTYYVYVILGVDADSFSLKGGDEYFKKAENVMLLAQQSGYKGWNSIDGPKTRFQFIDNILNPTYKDYRSTMYTYHLNGLDLMADNTKKAKQNIANAIIGIKKMYLKRPSAFLLRIFLDTKADEITSIFKNGAKIDTRNLKETLLKVYPARNDSWNKIN